MTQQMTEAELLELARKFSFRSRIDKNVVTGPIMVWGRGSVVRDVNGKEYLDFNSGQCAPLLATTIHESCRPSMRAGKP